MQYPPVKIIEEDAPANETVCIRSEALAMPRTPVRVEVRDGGLLKGKSFWLNAAYDWVIVKDDDGCLCLVPLHR